MRVGVLILFKVLCLYAFQFSPAYDGDVRIIGNVDIERMDENADRRKPFHNVLSV